MKLRKHLPFCDRIHSQASRRTGGQTDRRTNCRKWTVFSYSAPKCVSCAHIEDALISCFAGFGMCFAAKKRRKTEINPASCTPCCPKQPFHHSVFSPTLRNDAEKGNAGSIDKKTAKCSGRPPTAFQLVGKKAVHGLLSGFCPGVKGETRRFRSPRDAVHGLPQNVPQGEYRDVRIF